MWQHKIRKTLPFQPFDCANFCHIYFECYGFPVFFNRKLQVLTRRLLSSGLAGFSSGVARLATEEINCSRIVFEQNIILIIPGLSAASKVDSRPRALVVLVMVVGF